MIRLLVAVATLLTTVLAQATSVYYTKFGIPIVTRQRLFFSGPGWESNRLICVSRDSGKRIWEITADKPLTPRFVMGEKLIITRGADICSCAPEDGKTEFLFATGFKGSDVTQLDFPYALVQQHGGGFINGVSLVDLSKAERKWEIQGVPAVVAIGKDLILCQFGQLQTENRLTAVSKANGRTVWHYAIPDDAGAEEGVTWVGNLQAGEGIASGKYFLVNLGGTIHCIDQTSGAGVARLKLGDSRSTPVSLVARKDSVLAWTQEGKDVFTGHIIYSLSLPDLSKTEVLRPDWYSAESSICGDILIGQTIGRVDAYDIRKKQRIWQGGQWNWQGVHDGCIFFSTQDPDGKHTSVNSINIESGALAMIYREPLR